MDDMQLVQAYARDHAQEAFAQLVARHLDWVHAACVRQVHDRHLAEDVTQAVFIILARKAGQLPPDTVLTGWLFKTARYCCSNAMKKQAIRRIHETKAAAMNAELAPAPDASWDRISEILDSGVAALSEADRNALLLRFYSGLSTREVAQSMNLSEEAARQRLSRAVGRLRRWFSRRDVGISSTGLVALLAVETVHAAPAHLSSSVLGAALALPGVAVSASAGAIAHSAMQAMALAKLKIAASLLLTAAVAFWLVIATTQHLRSAAALPSGADTPHPASPPAASTTLTPGPLTGAPRNLSQPAAALISFPADGSLGDLFVKSDRLPDQLDDFGAPSDSEDGWTWLGPARGQVPIPANHRLWLRLNTAAQQDLSPLVPLGAARIYKISIRSTPSAVAPADASLVTCLAQVNGLVILDLRNTSLQGVSLSPLVRLSSLRSILLSSTDDAAVTQLAQIPSLRGLFLFPSDRRSNLPAPRVTDAAVSALARHPAVESLALGGAQLTDLALVDLARLPRLQRLTLWSGEFSAAGLAQLGQARALRHLRLSRIGPLGDDLLAALAPLGDLESLTLEGGIFTEEGAARLTAFPLLHRLAIDGGAFPEPALASLAQLPRLRSLCLTPAASARPIGDAGALLLASLRNLEELQLRADRLSDRGVSHLSRLRNLRRLSLSGCRGLTNEGLLSIARLASLERLSLDQTGVSASGLWRLQDLKLRTLIVRGLLSDDGQLELGRQPGLEHLVIDCPNGDDDLAGLLSAGALRTLEIRSTPAAAFTDAGLIRLSTLARLERLAIIAPSAHDSFLAGLANLRLTHLVIRAPIPSRSLSLLRGMSTLRCVDLDSTPLIPVSPDPLEVQWPDPADPAAAITGEAQ